MISERKERLRASCTRTLAALPNMRFSIIEKLTELGWGDEIDMLLDEDDLGGHKLVRQPTLLTERSELASTFNFILRIDILENSLEKHLGTVG
jgi:hypothetical protein